MRKIGSSARHCRQPRQYGGIFYLAKSGRFGFELFCAVLLFQVMLVACFPSSSQPTALPDSQPGKQDAPSQTPGISLPGTPTPHATPQVKPNDTDLPTTSQESGCSLSNDPQVARVIDVIDGDTIEVEIHGERYKVRYIGIDTPELAETADYYAQEASQINRDMVLGKDVSLVKDVSETDVYGRLLRYVYVDSLFVNAELVRGGYARAISYPPDTACDTWLAQVEAQARKSQLGLWGAVSTSMTGERCDPAYPDVCIPSPPPDLDCKDITYRRFRVLPPDPHHFDINGDGQGCEGE